MSDILIKGMEMPKRCFECIFLTTVPNFCCLAGKRDLCAEHGINISRPDWCPLIELPPHGRLGDLDALYEEISNGNKAYNGIEGYDGEYQHIGDVDDCLDVIKYAETVIEAEGSETDA